MIRRALLSVSDKSGIEDLANALTELDVELIATSGTARLLRSRGIKVTDVSQVTGFAEFLDGRMKTIHPAIHGAILAVRSSEEHMKQLEEHGIKPIDMVVTNLYPFKETVRKGNVELLEAMEKIDIGGPVLIRSSALNYRDVVVIVDPNDYETVIDELKRTSSVSLRNRYKLAYKAFMHTSHYDTLIQNYFHTKLDDGTYPQVMTLTYEKVQDMRYGENPHQKAAFYREIGPAVGCISDARQLNGKELSYNNICDSNEAIELLKEFEEPTVVVVKNANPSAVGSGATISEAWEKAFEADPVSIFGGIVAFNREIDKETAAKLSDVFLEVLIAPSFEEEAAGILKLKKNLRVLQLDNIMKKLPEGSYDLEKVVGGLLIQTYNDRFLNSGLMVVTRKQPSEEELENMKFAMKVAKHSGSNAIVIAKNGMTLGIGQGQSSRINAVKIAVENAGIRVKGAVLASDGFLAFADSLEEAAKAGVTAIIQPGGAQRDEELIKKCDQYGIAMVFTGIRHFKH